MKKTLFILSFAIFGMYAINNSANAQAVYFEDNFDSYTAGQRLVGQATGTPWRTWSNGSPNSENPMVSNAEAETAPNSVFIQNSNDLYFPFPNFTSGKFSIEFDYFIVSSGNGGYFNIQHYTTPQGVPGEQWAFGVYFYNNGTGFLTVAGVDYTFNYGTANSWFNIFMIINIDDDIASLEINGVEVHSWAFHLHENSTSAPPMYQLGGVNIYAGSPVPNPSNPNQILPGTYYMDNFKVIDLEGYNPGVFVVDPTDPIDLELDVDEIVTKTFNISNPGGAPVNFKIVSTASQLNQTYTPSTPMDVSYHIESSSYGGIYYTGIQEYTIAMGIPASTLENHIGKAITKFEIAMGQGQLATTAKVVVYKMNYVYDYAPSTELIYEQSFSPTASAPQTFAASEITLTTPVIIDGGDLWIGVNITTPVPQSGGGNVPTILLDENTNPGVNSGFVRTGGSWSKLSGDSENPRGNFIMTATINGTQSVPGKWITITPSNGTLDSDEEIEVTVEFGPNVPADKVFFGAIHFISDDFVNYHIPVDFIINYENPSILTDELPNGELGFSYSQQIVATGTPVIKFELVSGNLPTGLNLSSQGLISGIPIQGGLYEFTVKASNDGGSDIKVLTITIEGDVFPEILTDELPDGTVGDEYEAILEANTEVTWSLDEDSNLPDGLELSEDGVISGIPTEEGIFEFTIVATNSVGFASQDLIIKIEPSGIYGKTVAQTLKVFVQNGILHVSGLTPGEKLSVYNMSGVLVYENIAKGETVTVKLSVSSGIYTVKSGSSAEKVVF